MHLEIQEILNKQKNKTISSDRDAQVNVSFYLCTESVKFFASSNLVQVELFLVKIYSPLPSKHLNLTVNLSLT